jgi:5'-3' exonuclease
MTNLLIDGDIVAYRAAAGAEQPVNWGDGLWTLHSYEADVRKAVDETIAKLVEDSGADVYETPLSCTHNFRKTVADYYKANRKDVRKPMLLAYAKEYIMEKHNGMVWKNLEADDVLGILTSHSSNYLCFSQDKDLRTIPGRHWIDGKEVIITEDEADLFFFTQVLTGDITDNYKGCPKIGAKTAEKILKDVEPKDYWQTVVHTFYKAGLGAEVALENARLARILRDGEYDVTTNEVKLWTP